MQSLCIGLGPQVLCSCRLHCTLQYLVHLTEGCIHMAEQLVKQHAADTCPVFCKVWCAVTAACCAHGQLLFMLNAELWL